MTTLNSITKILTTPAKFASQFNWKKASAKVLSLEIQKGRIGLAVASHPSFQESVHVLEPLPLSRRALADTIPNKLQEIVKQENICGFVVSWPIQQDTGKLGYSCGLVLNTLEQILEQTSDNPIMTSSRPVCLWDGAHTNFPSIDMWGRCPDYAHTSNNPNHLASAEQYHVPSQANAASEAMKDFFQVNWPQLHYAQQQNHRMFSSESTQTDQEWHNESDTLRHVV
ncbi:MAG: hypothetical protein SGBAC_000517 [Bacillariaceae sp.]